MHLRISALLTPTQQHLKGITVATKHDYTESTINNMQNIERNQLHNSCS